MKLLLLAGTGDARRLAEAFHQMDEIAVTASLAGATRQPAALPGAMRVGGFGGVAGFRAYLESHDYDAVIDATHPFAAKMSATAAQVCQGLRINHVQLLRPGWQPGPGDAWHFVDREEQVANLIADGSVVFLGTGRQHLERFSNLAGCTVICRQIDPPDQPFPFANGQYLVGRPPFSESDETALFTRLKVDWLVVKNAGGQPSRSKLDAARHLNIPVAVINRPPQPDCDRVQSVAEALHWVRDRVANL